MALAHNYFRRNKINRRPPMNTKTKRLQFCLIIGSFVLLNANLVAGIASSEGTNNADNDSLALKILRKSQSAYNSLSNYNDVGKITTEINGRTLTTTFDIRMARQNMYRIQWEQTQGTATMTMTTRGAAWSAGEGDFVLSAGGVQRIQNRDMALATAAGISANASVTVPGAFFDIEDFGSFKQLITQSSGLFQKQDETIGGVDCYVIAGSRSETGQKTTTTLWIGKKDSLIHESRRAIEHIDETSNLEGLDAATKEKLQQMQRKPVIFTETHENISTNNSFKESDFVHDDPTNTVTGGLK
jgi:hypothetical protein